MFKEKSTDRKSNIKSLILLKMKIMTINSGSFQVPGRLERAVQIQTID